jgi:thioredoxin-related protein
MKELSDRESKESSLASMAYQKALDEFQALFKRHRDFARIFFKDEPEVLVTLGVRGEFPENYRDLFTKSKAFYQAIQDDPA